MLIRSIKRRIACKFSLQAAAIIQRLGGITKLMGFLLIAIRMRHSMIFRFRHTIWLNIF